MHDPIIKTKKEISGIFSTLLLKKKENKKNSNKLIQIRKKGKGKCKEEGCNVNKKKKKIFPARLSRMYPWWGVEGRI